METIIPIIVAATSVITQAIQTLNQNAIDQQTALDNLKLQLSSLQASIQAHEEALKE